MLRLNKTKNVIPVEKSFGDKISGDIVVMTGGFSPRYHLNRETGEFSVSGHPVDGEKLSGKILICDYARGGIAAGWALNMLKDKDFAPSALIFMRANPVMVQGAIFTNIPIAEGFDQEQFEKLQNSIRITLDPEEKQLIIEK